MVDLSIVMLVYQRVVGNAGMDGNGKQGGTGVWFFVLSHIRRFLEMGDTPSHHGWNTKSWSTWIKKWGDPP